MFILHTLFWMFVAFGAGSIVGEAYFKKYLYLKATSQGSRSFKVRDKWLRVEEE